jgi:hypothetical protein
MKTDATPGALGSNDLLGLVPERAAACQHKRYTVDVQEQTGCCIDCGAEGRMMFVVGTPVAAERERWRNVVEHAAKEPEKLDEETAQATALRALYGSNVRAKRGLTA